MLLNYLGYKEKICPFFILQKRIRMQFYFFLYIFIFKYILKAIEIIFFYFECKYIFFFEKIQNIQIFPKLVYFLFFNYLKALKRSWDLSKIGVYLLAFLAICNFRIFFFETYQKRLKNSLVLSLLLKKYSKKVNKINNWTTNFCLKQEFNFIP